MAKKGVSGSDAFEAYYRDRYGERWLLLRESLLSPVRQVTPGDSLIKPYFMDVASLEAALALPPVDNGSVLDMCAAPGGKSLVLASRLGSLSVLTANELSRDRKSRLITVLDQHLEGSLRARVTVTGRDASRWSRYEKDAYDRILLDAPCSSERHVLSAPAYLAEWTPSRIRNLALRQWALLSGAWLVLKPGGFLLYSTCALSFEENDGVIERLFKKYPDAILVDPGLGLGADYVSPAENTRYGRHILPDTASGAGPIYYSLIAKRRESSQD